MTPGSRHLRVTLASALAALGLDRRTAFLLGATAAVTLLAVLPVAGLAKVGTDGITTSLELTTVRGGGLGLPWSDGRTPADTQRHAIDVLFGLLTALALATLASGAVTIAALIGAREGRRSPEHAVRRAVGASRRVLRHAAVLEAAGIASMGVGAGVCLGAALGHYAISSWPGTVTAANPAASLIAAGAMVTILVLGAIVPLVFARERRMTDAEPAPRAIFGPGIAQFATSLAVLVTASLVHRYAADVVERSSAGEGGEVLELTAKPASAADLGNRYAVLLDRLGADSTLVSLTSPGAITGLGTIATVITDCGHCRVNTIYLPMKTLPAIHHIVSPDSFQALGIHLVAGRTLRPIDRRTAAPVAVVSRSLARQHFQRGEAIGRQMLVGDDKRWYTVVGVVEDVPGSALGSRFQPSETVYLSILQHPTSAADLLIRSRGPRDAAEGVRHAAEALLPTLHFDVASTTLARLRAGEAMSLSWFARWIAVEGYAATLLAALGLMAVLQIWVRSLMPELGLRRALGATSARILLLVLGQAAAVALIGIAAGAWFGASVWNVLPTILRGAATWDWRALALSASPLVIATLAGALLPAIRATRDTPAGLLQSSG